MAAKEVALHDPPSDGVSSLSFSRTEASLLAVSSWDCTVRLYDAGTNTLRGTYRHQAPALDVAFCGGGGKVVSGGLDRVVMM